MNEELKLLQHTWVEIWKIYMQWFTWHFGIQVAALAWVFTIKAAAPYARGAAIFMALLGLLALIASYRMERFDESVQRRARELDSSQQESPVFAAALTGYARTATMITNAFILVAWVYAAAALPASQNKDDPAIHSDMRLN
jgi:hypothetical protein